MHYLSSCVASSIVDIRGTGHDGGSLHGFADWDIDVPYVSGTFTQVHGWTLYPSGGTNRCTDTTNLPYTYISSLYGGAPIGQVWSGNHLHIPGAGEQELLINNQTKSPAYASRGSYVWVAANNWKLSCIPNVQNNGNGVTGEGFVAISPSGVSYTFDWAITRQSSSIEFLYKAGPYNSHISAARINVFLLATHVQDRFGNWVNYTYGGPNHDQLTNITSSDGRTIDLHWNGDTVDTVTSALGKWIYGYSPASWTNHSSDGTPIPDSWSYLSSVTRPDLSTWTYNINSGDLLTQKNDWPDDTKRHSTDCQAQMEPQGNSGGLNYTVGTPSGATAIYDFFYGRLYRNYVPLACPGDTSPYGTDNYPTDLTAYFDNFQLRTKTVSGPALPAQTWSYQYRPTNYPGDMYFLSTQRFFSGGDLTVQPFIPPGNCPNNCQLSNIVTVTGPTAVTKYEFGRQYARNEGQLLSTEVDDRTSGAALKTTTNVYVSDGNGPSEAFANIAGWQELDSYKDPMSYRNRPVVATQIAQDGATFTTTVNSNCTGTLDCFDAFARATSETASSSLGYSKTEATVYSDNLTAWVLGQVASNSVNGIVASSATYDATTALPLTSYAFGKLIATKTWNGDGTLASITDGNNHKTTLSSWYRGIPRNVTYADNTTQSATVNDAGWITAVVDENGYATGYGYDAMGRVASIAYPTGDDVAWTATIRTFAQVGSTEYGIPAGHWKQTVHTGNGYAVTYYDALWRPLVTDSYDAGNVAATRSVSVTRYDAGGRAIFASYPLSSLSSYTSANTGAHTFYDALDRAIETDQDSELGTLKSFTTYLPGFKTQVKDPRGYATTTSYMAYDAPSTAWPVSIVSPESETTTITRDVFGKPTKLIRSGPYGGGTLLMQRMYVYDANQQLCKRIDPESSSTVMAYDLAGNLQWSAAGLNLPSPTTCDTSTAYASGRRVDRTYDPRNHLATLTFPDHQGDQSWSYTPDGLPNQVSTYTPNGGHHFINAYTYDKRRLLTGESVGQAGWYTDAIGYAYDANAHLSTEHRPSTLNYAYAPNALGQATQIATPGLGTYVSGVSYYPDGKVARYTLGNGIVHALTENVRNLPARITDAGAQGQPGSQDAIYTYDADGNVQEIQDVARTGFTRVMAYDGLDRVFDIYGSQFPGGHHYVYSYDPLDNIRILNRGNVQTTTYNYDATNRLTQLIDSVAGTSTLSYDVQGNLATRNGVQYQFDYGNRLREVPGQEYEYGYDAYGRRIVQLASDGGILNQYSRDGKLVYSAAGRTGLVRDYLYLNGSLVASHNWVGGVDQGIRYQTTDALGSVIAQTNQAAWVDHFNYYDPYGALLSISGPAKDGPGYAGQITDERTNLSYAQQRYYDPSLGRFLSMDPVDANTVTGSNFNRYIYANDNPYRFTDPDGRQSAEDYQNLQQQQQSMPDVPMTLVSMDGHWQPVPTAVAADVMLSRDAGTSTAQYNHTPTREETASALDKTSVGATTVAVATAADAPPVAAVAGIVHEAAAVTAFALSPTTERAANVATVGALGALKVAAKGSEQAGKAVGALEKATQATTLVKASMPSPQNQQRIQPPPPPPPRDRDH